LGERFRLLEFGLFVVGSAEANWDESIAFQNVTHPAESIVDPKGFISEVGDFFGGGPFSSCPFLVSAFSSRSFSLRS